MPTFPKADVTQFFRTFSIQNFIVDPHEEQLICSTNLSGHFNLWALDLNQRFPYPLTSINQSNHGLAYDKNGHFLLSAFDHDGDENAQIYALPPEGGTLLPIQVNEGERHMLGELSEDGRMLYYTSTKENSTYLNIYRYDIENEKEEVLIEGKEAATSFAALGPDERSFLLRKHFANTHSCMYVHKNGRTTAITPDPTIPHTVESAAYTTNKDVYLATTYEADFSYLAHFHVDQQTFTKILDIPGESIINVHFDQSSNGLYLVTSKGVTDQLYYYHLVEEKLTSIDLPVEVVDKLMVTNGGIPYILGRGSTLPMNIFRRKVKTWETITDLRVPGIAREAMSEPETIRYPSYDETEIEALYFKPKPEVDNSHLILWPHGGPQAAERKMFRAMFQMLVYEGYRILAPNFRGSSNYGLSFMKEVEGDWGYGPRLDNVAALDYMIENNFVDRDKIFLIGGSYGGYMALLLHGRHGDYFKAVVDIFGVSNLFSFVESVPDFWKPIMKQWVGDPLTDQERFKRDSPITYLEQMSKPMFIIQGANDPRVVKAESDQVVDKLRANNVAVKYLVLDDEGHGFSKKDNEIEVNRQILQFFNNHQ
ncbi:dipeptidyl aminopeptidase/acylaminoacyl peptidase [Geomicrobium halophilum]|uniref:Acyl-peptide hydrolase n=1 Tax=Geomicrobium halophilum TaxID=549000 RepID=A0A841Q063_9BACL|nr:prolyl oligopeptidase family serine peptidase [Geomicrobium halophilum]MBB6450712.1 dipeptidyl aminopeptidase/acylaminoacyl peptidase [Geomicrobium halophilum]